MSISSIISSVVGVSAGLYYTCKIVFPKLFTVVDAESTTATSTVAVSTIFGPSLFFDSFNFCCVAMFGIGRQSRLELSYELLRNENNLLSIRIRELEVDF